MKYLNKYAWGLALALCGMLLVSTAQAQSENYGIYRNSDNGAFRTGGTAANTTFTAIKDASLTFTISQSVQDHPRGGSSVASPSPITLGVYTYTIDSRGRITIQNSTAFSGLYAGDTVNTADALEIKAGEMVGMYVQRQTAGLNGIQTSYLTPGSGVGGLPRSTVQSSAHAQYAQSGTDGLGYFEMDNSWPTDRNLNIDVLVSIVGAAPAQSGQPLPGVLATVALCGAVGGYLRRKKNAARIDQE